MDPMDTAVEIDGVSKAYDDFSVRDVSFRVPRGYITGLIGPNGAGKTTLIRLLLGLAKRDGGRITVLGHDPETEGALVRARIGFVHDTPVFYDHLSAERMGAIVAPFYPTWDAPLFDRLLREFDLPPRRPLQAHSRGMRMKFALALAFSHRAELLVLDEPTGGLDPVFRRDLLDRLSASIADQGASVLFSTQIMSDLERTADYLAIVREGRLVHWGAKDDILEHWGVVRGGPELAAELTAAAPRGVASTKQGIEALFEDIDDARRRFGARAVVDRATLDDAFLLCRTPREEA